MATMTVDVATATIEQGAITKVTAITKSNVVEGNQQQEGTPTGLAPRSFSWVPLHSGDGQQNNGVLTINSDGSAVFSCTTLTYHTHSGDVWHASFTALDKNGAAYFTTPTFNSPRMNDGNPPPQYPWKAYFTFPAYDFSGIMSFTQHYSC